LYVDDELNPVQQDGAEIEIRCKWWRGMYHQTPPETCPKVSGGVKHQAHFTTPPWMLTQSPSNFKTSGDPSNHPRIPREGHLGTKILVALFSRRQIFFLTCIMRRY
jgi:hypothetical protein